MTETWIQFVLKKVLEFAASLFCLAALTFFLLKALPGGPFDEEAALHPLAQQTLENHWGLQEPVVMQFVHYIGSVVQGDLGQSMVQAGQPVAQIIQRDLGNTISLNILSLILVFVGAFALSLLAVRGAWYNQEAGRSSILEKIIDQSMIALISLPSLFIGPLLIYFFCFYWNLLPVAFLSSPVHYILPVITLSLRPLAYLVRLLKNSLSENLSHDYIRTARAKGLSPSHILMKHVLRVSLVPLISYAGPLIVSLISGSFLVEMLFAVPGLGSEFIRSLSDRDYTVITGLALFYGLLLISINLLSDVLLRWVDPRLKEPA